MINFLHTFQPTAIAFELGSLTIHWYGIMVVLGMFAGIGVLQALAKKINKTKEDIYDLAFYIILFSLIGARIYAVFLELPYYVQNPDQVIAVWNGGLAIHGGIIGGIIALAIYSKKKKHNPWKWADILAPALALGQVFGRWGNYFNQELFGRPTDLPWGIPIAPSHRPVNYQATEYFHPTFLYESLLNLINFLILFFLVRKFYSKQTNRQFPVGTVALIYVINYGVIRILMEQVRIDGTPDFFGVRVPVIASIILIIVAAILFVLRSKKSTHTSL